MRHFRVWAVARRGDGAVLRATYGSLTDAEIKAGRIAGASEHDEEEGAVSVWIEDEGAVVWAAGLKAQELAS